MNKERANESNRVSSEREVKMISLHRFYHGAISRCGNTRERYGQAMFNHLSEIRPDLAEKIRATNMDPFHVDRPSDPRFDRFVEFIEKHWFS